MYFGLTRGDTFAVTDYVILVSPVVGFSLKISSYVFSEMASNLLWLSIGSIIMRFSIVWVLLVRGFILALTYILHIYELAITVDFLVNDFSFLTFGEYYYCFSKALVCNLKFSNYFRSDWFCVSYFLMSNGTTFYAWSKQSFISFESKLFIHCWTSKALCNRLFFLFIFACLVSLPCGSKLLRNFSVMRTTICFNCLWRIWICRPYISWSIVLVFSYNPCLNYSFLTYYSNTFSFKNPGLSSANFPLASYSKFDFWRL